MGGVPWESDGAASFACTRSLLNEALCPRCTRTAQREFGSWVGLARWGSSGGRFASTTSTDDEHREPEPEEEEGSRSSSIIILSFLAASVTYSVVRTKAAASRVAWASCLLIRSIGSIDRID